MEPWKNIPNRSLDTMHQMNRRVRLLYCYAAEDEPLREVLDRHLSSLKLEGLLESWHQQLIPAGSERQAEITAQLAISDIVLLLVSADFMASDECQAFAAEALARHQTQDLRLVPVLTRPTDWQASPFGQLPSLPVSGQPVTRWLDRDDAWLDVALGIRRLLQQFTHSRERPWAPANPYRGLESFEPEDENIFFGREELTCRLHQAYAQMNAELDGIRVLAILGASGSGKSSVAKAGLVPALRRHPLPDRPASEIVICRPGNRPVESLAQALLPLAPAANHTLMAVRLVELTQLLHHRDGQGNPDGLRLFASTLPIVRETRLLVLVDQFEEVYAQCKEKDERDLFVALLLHAASDPESLVSLVLTLRSDFLGDTHQHPTMSAAICQRTIVVTVMSEENIRQAIALPAVHAGKTLPESTVSLLLEQTRGRDGALPLLEFALQRIWETWDNQSPDKALRDIGGVGGALTGRAQEIYGELEPEDQKIARRLFVSLVQIGEGAKDTRRRVSLQDLVAHGEDVTRLRAVAFRFSLAGSRLVTLASDENGRETAELTHEALLEQWQPLREWVERQREDLRFNERLADGARRWESLGCPQGMLWRPPELDQLCHFAGRISQREMDIALSRLQTAFYEASLIRQKAQEAEERRHLEAEQMRRNAERRRSRLLIGFLAAIALIFAGLGLGMLQLQQREQRRLIELYQEQGRQELDRGDPLKALVYLSKAYTKVGPKMAGPALKLLLHEAARSADAQQMVLSEHRGSVTSVSFSPDGARILTSSADKKARVWDSSSGKLLLTVQIQGWLHRAAFSFDGKRIVTGETQEIAHKIGSNSIMLDQGVARVWDASSGSLLQTLGGHGEGIWSVALSPDGTRIVTGSRDYTARVWDAATGNSLLILRGHRGPITSVAISPDGTRVLTSAGNAALWEKPRDSIQKYLHENRDTTVRVWDIASGNTLLVLQGHEARVNSVAFSLDGSRILTGSDDQTARVWDAISGKSLLILKGHDASVRSVAFSPDSAYILTGGDDNTARVWDSSSGKSLWTLCGHSASVTSVAFSLDGARILTGSDDRTARVWNVTMIKSIMILHGHRSSIWKVAFSPNGTRILTGGGEDNINHRVDDSARIWDPVSGKSLLTLRGHQNRVSSVAFSPHGSHVLTGSWDKTARVWDSSSGECLLTLGGHEEGITSVSFSPDGTRILTGSDDKTARIWDAVSGQLILTLKGHADQVMCVAFSPNGSRIVTGSTDNTARIWDASSGKSLLTLQGHADTVGSVAFSPDGTLIATSSPDKTARVWNAISGEALLTLQGHRSQVTEVAFSPDGLLILSGSTDGTARIWEAVSGKPLLTFQGHDGAVMSVAFSPDGTRILTGSSDTTSRIWDIAEEVRHPHTVAALVMCRALHGLDEDGHIQPAQPQLQNCPMSLWNEPPEYELFRALNLRASAAVLSLGNPLLAKVYANRALTFFRKHGRWEEEANTHLHLGEFAVRAKKARDAEEAYNAARSLGQVHAYAPLEALALWRLGNLKFELLHDVSAALTDLNQANALAPHDSSILADRAEICLAAGKFLEFFEDFDNALSRQKRPEIRTILAAYAWAAALLSGRADVGQRVVVLGQEYAKWPIGNNSTWRFDGIRHALRMRQDHPMEIQRILSLLELLARPKSSASEKQIANLLSHR